MNKIAEVTIRWFEDGAWHYFSTNNPRVFRGVIEEIEGWEYIGASENHSIEDVARMFGVERGRIEEMVESGVCACVDGKVPHSELTKIECALSVA